MSAISRPAQSQASIYIKKAGSEHISLRKLASHKLEDDLIAISEKTSGVKMTKTDISRMEAASSQYAKTGTCGSFVANTTALHAAKLADVKNQRADAQGKKGGRNARLAR